ncbi:hypothetical protein BDF20DRAFT_808281, partial [Mycotypha africana]|uniref:uncharacterized protein n=1 Tax=Mycotypha africana TaxID=64632 RepID=UPI002300D1A3
MTDSWDRTIFEQELQSLLDGKLPVSASKITALQSLATNHPQHHNYITHCIARFIETAPPDYRLAGLYVIDAISRAVHKQQRKREENNEQKSHELDGYLKRFAIVLKEDSLRGCFEPCSQKDKEKARKTLDFWEQGNVYSKDTMDYVKNHLFNTVTTTKAEDNKAKVEVDTAKLLATLSNIGNGSLAATLNIPGLTASSVSQSTPPSQQQPLGDGAQGSSTPTTDDKQLPPALAKLLGGLVSSTPSDASTPTPPALLTPVATDMPAAKTETPNPPSEPSKRQGVWPPPQGPSIPRKSRWNPTNDTPARMSPKAPAPFYPQMSQQDPAQAPYDPHQPSSQQYASSPPPPPPPQANTFAYPQRQSSSFKGAPPQHDPSLSPGCIRVLTRTLFVGPIPDHFEREDVERNFERYGELRSVIVSKKFRGKHNAFLKYTTRAATERAKYEADGMRLEHNQVK